MNLKKLNFGCGSRFSPNWVNIDVYTVGPEVQRVNLLKRFPFQDGEFDAVYSSHVLEHFTPSQANQLISEAYRVMRPGGILRIVVPDLEASCREYLRLLDSSTTSHMPKEYNWIILEVLDQLTRSTPSGEMRPYFQALRESGDTDLRSYVQSRTELVPTKADVPSTFLDKLRTLSPQRIYNKLFYLYLHLVSRALPEHIRSQVMVLTPLGERHRWMYDRVGLALLLEKQGFHQVRVHQSNTSSIPDFNDDCLDIEPDGTPYKRVSLYMEAIKPTGEGQPVASATTTPSS
jgi:predicted SAM-dependent methyltransferase